MASSTRRPLDVLSPESTVTSLLSSSGHLKSSLRDPEHNTSFRYRDEVFESASAALDAYISDFERSHLVKHSSAGRLLLPEGRPQRSVLRNRDVLRERLTDEELAFLHLPVSSLCHRGNRDRVSMTTDELLAIPNDGSMPITHTSAFIHSILRSQSGASRPDPGLGRSVNQHRPHPTRTLRSCRCRGRAPRTHVHPDVDFSSVSGFKPPHRPVKSEWAGLDSSEAHSCRPAEWAEPDSSELHLPHWFTSNKADMDCSGISSVPDLRYPAWVRRCGSTETESEPEPWDEQAAAQRTTAPSWVKDLDDGSEQVGGQLTLRDLRLQFAEQISRLATDKPAVDAVFSANRIEYLIQKADQVLESLSQSSTGVSENFPDPASPADDVNSDMLLTDSAVGRVSRPSGLSVSQLLQSISCGLPGNSVDSSLHGSRDLTQPGPVEALKQMVFRLQAVEAELHKRQQRQALSEAHVEKSDADSGTGESLQRALHHLSRLKILVEQPPHKHPDDGNRGQDGDQDGERDGGQSSSLLAKGLT